MKNTIFTSNVFEYIEQCKEYLIERLNDYGIENNENNLIEEAQDAIQVEFQSIEDTIDWFDSKHKHKVLVVGTCGLWYGNVKGGKIYKDLQTALQSLYQDENELFFNKKNTTLELKAIHHDGTNHFKFYELTNKGEEFVLNYENEFDPRTLHTKLVKNGYVRAITFDKLYGAC